MIKAKTNTFGFWLTPIMIVIMVGLFVRTFFISGSEKDKLISRLFLIFFLVLLIPQLWVTAKLMTINTFGRTISFTHFFTGHRMVYNFSDFDGYVCVVEVPLRERPLG
jgi:hypothetical protein